MSFCTVCRVYVAGRRRAIASYTQPLFISCRALTPAALFRLRPQIAPVVVVMSPSVVSSHAIAVSITVASSVAKPNVLLDHVCNADRKQK